MGENTHQNCTRQNKNKEDPGRQQPCWGFLFCTNLTQPTGNLDSRTEMEVISLLKSCVADYCQTLVMITHDETVAQMADRILIIEDGRVVANQ
nr:hypothetical protein [Eisenbergiella tayi]